MKINDDIVSDKHGSGKGISEEDRRIAGPFDVYIMSKLLTIGLFVRFFYLLVP